MGMENLKIYQKVYDFSLYAFPIIDKFPKREKFALCTNIKNSILTLQRLIIKANKSRNKKPFLYDADVEIEQIRFLIRFSYDKKFLSHKAFVQISERLREIGKLLGGWIKSLG
jgi:four helix bundle protein